MSNTLQEILQEFDSKFTDIDPGDPNIGLGIYRAWKDYHNTSHVREFLQEKLVEYARSVIPRVKPAECECDGSGNDLSGYCNCGFSYNVALDDMLYHINQDL